MHLHDAGTVRPAPSSRSTFQRYIIRIFRNKKKKFLESFSITSDLNSMKNAAIERVHYHHHNSDQYCADCFSFFFIIYVTCV